MMDEKTNDISSEEITDTAADVNEDVSEEVNDTETIEAETEIHDKKDKKSKKEQKEIAEIKKQLEEANKKNSETEDKYLRIMAEYDNFRKRSSKDLESRYSDAYSDALMQILPVIDNIERASMYAESDKVAEGISMIVKTFPETLEKMGVEAFGNEGDPFDPNFHNAVMQVEDENRKEGEIVSVLQKGYKRGDRVIRYAMVTVAN